MADIRKRVGTKGITYQVRYPSKATKSGYAFKTFDTRKEARAFIEGGETRKSTNTRHNDIRTVSQAVDKWLDICEKEGLGGREPVTGYTHENYRYRAEIIRSYDWEKPLCELQTPDIVEFRSWLLRGDLSRDLARKVLASFQSIMKEMALRGVLQSNVATGVSITSESRYQQSVSIPTKNEIMALLDAADSLSNSKNETIAKAWQRYRPMLYLAVDSGMRPQEYIALSTSAIKKTGVQVERAVDGSGHELSVTKTPAGKRFIEISPEVLDMVRHYSDKHAVKNAYDLVFPAANGKWLCRKNWQRRGFNVACEKAGLMQEQVVDGVTIQKPKYRPYDLRHFYASMLIESETNLKKIQILMGHTNIETTLNVYGHLLEDNSDTRTGATGTLGRLMRKTCGESVAGLC